MVTMKTLEDGQKKIQQICDLLKKDAVEPAKKEAEAIIDEAKARAQEIITEAENQAKKHLNEAKKAIEQEKSIFQSFMVQAAKQTMESLRQEIEKKFFKSELHRFIIEHTVDPKVIARLIEAVISAIEKEGMSANLSVAIPKAVSPKEVNTYLAENTLNKLKEKSVVIGDFAGGVQIKLHDKEMTIDITDEALVDLLSIYRKGFRDLLFKQ
jgi:V/A-type H+-transporting ATPase subunit E